jgi:uncharacterized protein (DUF2147 family)
MARPLRPRLGALLLAFAAFGCAAAATPEGLWKSIDDDTGQARSWIRIRQAGGEYSGRIERVLDADAKPGDVCEACTDDRRNQPIVGLEIIRHARASAKDPAAFEGGEILDPEDGKVYRLLLRLEDGGKRLLVRGYWGPFYRTQVWVRPD